MLVREATALDADGLMDVMAACPQGQDIAITTVNTPDFFARARAYDAATVFVAEDGGEIAGSAAGAIREQVVDGKLRRVGYEFQYFTAPEHRRKGVAGQLRQAIERYFREQQVELSTAAIIATNSGSLRLFESQGFHPRSEMTCHFLLTFREMQVEHPGTVVPASPGDLDSVAALLNRCWSGYDFYQPVTRRSLERFIDRTPAFNAEDLLVLEEDGEIVACAGIWDWSKIMRIQVASVPPALHAKSVAVGIARRFWPMPRLLRRGMTLRQWGLTPLGYQEPRHLAALLRAINNLAVNRGIEQIGLALQQGQAAGAALRGFSTLDINFRLYVKPLDGQAFGAEAPVHFDMVDL